MRYADVVRRGPGQYWDQLEKDHDIKVVLLDMSFSRYYDLAKYLLSSLRWQLVFIDGRSLVLVRKGEFRFPYEVEQLEARLRAVVLQQDKILLLQGLSMMPHVTTWQEHLWHPFPHFVNILEEGLTLFAVGFQGEGVDRILNAFAVNPVMARGVATNILLQRRERWLRK